MTCGKKLIESDIESLDDTVDSYGVKSSKALKMSDMSSF